LTDRVFRPSAVTIGVNTTLLAGADALGLKTEHGGLLRLLEDVADGIAVRLGLAAWWSAATLPVVSSAHFEFFFHVFVGLVMAVFYAYVLEPALIGRPWVKGLIYAVAVWMLNAIIVLPLIGEGLAGSRHLGAAGMIAFAAAHTIFFVLLVVFMRRCETRLHNHPNWQASKLQSVAFSAIQSLHLDLNGGTVLIGGTGRDDEVATRYFVLAAHHLLDWSDRIDDGRAGRVSHKALQRLDNSGARRLIGKRKQVRLFRL
jgi:hypothetical protein